MNVYATHSQALAALQARLAQACPVVTWSGSDYAVIASSAQRKMDLSAGGFQLNADFRFEALVSTFGYDDASALKDDMLQTPLGYLCDTYRVTAIYIRPGNLQITVECMAMDQGA